MNYYYEKGLLSNVFFRPSRLEIPGKVGTLKFSGTKGTHICLECLLNL